MSKVKKWDDITSDLISSKNETKVIIHVRGGGTLDKKIESEMDRVHEIGRKSLIEKFPDREWHFTLSDICQTVR